MATRDEINGMIWHAQGQIDKYQRTVDDCDAKIARLEPVYDALDRVKSDFRAARKATEGVIQEKGSWRGERHTAFRNAGDTVDASCEEYYRKLDSAQDAVNRKIADLKTEKRELVPLIGRLWGQIEQWKVDFENALN